MPSYITCAPSLTFAYLQSSTNLTVESPYKITTSDEIYLGLPKVSISYLLFIYLNYLLPTHSTASFRIFFSRTRGYLLPRSSHRSTSGSSSAVRACDHARAHNLRNCNLKNVSGFLRALFDVVFSSASLFIQVCVCFTIFDLGCCQNKDNGNKL